MALFSKGGAIRSPEFHKKKQKERNKKLVVIVIFVIFLIGLPIYLLRISPFLVSSIIVEGNSVTSYEDVASIVKKNLEGYYMFIFPKSNALLYPKKSITKDLLLNIPRLNNVKVSLINPKSLKIEIEERQPTGLYCLDVKVLSEGCYYIDNEGYIYSKAPSFSGDVYFVYSAEPVIEEPLGKSFLTLEEFKKLPPFINLIKQIGVSLHSLTATTNEYYLILTGGGRIIINKQDDLKVVVENLESFLKDHAITTVPNFLEDVSYIDMRFGNKVFYKLKSEI